MEGAGDKPFLTQVSVVFTVLSRLWEFEEKTLIRIDSLFPVCICVHIHTRYIYLNEAPLGKITI